MRCFACVRHQDGLRDFGRLQRARNPHDDLRILGGDPGGRFGIVARGDVEKSQQARFRFIDDFGFERLEILAAGARDNYRRGHSAAQAIVIGRQVVEVGTQVNQSWNHIICAGIHNDARVSGRKIRRHAHDLVPHYGHIESPVALIGWVKHVPVLEQEIVDLLPIRRRRQQQDRKKALHGITLYSPAAVQTGKPRPSRS